jgi:hypothetical protein
MSPSDGTAFRTVAFGDVDGRLWGAAVTVDPARPAALLLGGSDTSVAVPGPTWTVRDRVWTLSGDGVELHVEALGEAPAAEGADRADGPSAEIGGVQELCHVHGRVALGGAEQTIDCAGTRSEIDGLKPGTIASARAVSGWFGPDDAITLIALRPQRASDHESDLIAATLFDHDGWVPVSDPRLSTTYTEAGDPARTSLELWVLDGENEVPRRAAGEASGDPVALSAGELQLRVAPMHCHSRGLEGAGVYVLVTL